VCEKVLLGARFIVSELKFNVLKITNNPVGADFRLKKIDISANIKDHQARLCLKDKQ
jgi:hypothetical protein